jgi:hypothetical protein
MEEDNNEEQKLEENVSAKQKTEEKRPGRPPFNVHTYHRKRRFQNLLFGTFVGGLYEFILGNNQTDQSELLAMDICTGITLAAGFFGLERLIIIGAETNTGKKVDFPVAYSAESAFYFGGGYVLGRNLVRAARNILYNTT